MLKRHEAHWRVIDFPGRWRRRELSPEPRHIVELEPPLVERLFPRTAFFDEAKFRSRAARQHVINLILICLSCADWPTT